MFNQSQSGIAIGVYIHIHIYVWLCMRIGINLSIVVRVNAHAIAYYAALCLSEGGNRSSHRRHTGSTRFYGERGRASSSEAAPGAAPLSAIGHQ